MNGRKERPWRTKGGTEEDQEGRTDKEKHRIETDLLKETAWLISIAAEENLGGRGRRASRACAEIRVSPFVSFFVSAKVLFSCLFMFRFCYWF